MKNLIPGAAKAVVCCALFSVMAGPAEAEWRHRYAQVEGYGHGVYLEGYELPILAFGPTDPAPAPNGREMAYADRGWIWVLNLETLAARRVTSSAGVDSRPAWSPDGERLAFVRDNGRDTGIVLLDLGTGTETVVIDTPAIDLDPFFAPDSRSLYYASAINGNFDIWRVNLTGGEPELVVDGGTMARSPVVTETDLLIYRTATAMAHNEIRVRDLETGEEKVLARASITGQADIALHPSGRSIVYTWPEEQNWRLLVAGFDDPVPAFEVTKGSGLPLMPAWSADGGKIYFSETVNGRNFTLRTVNAGGGQVDDIEIASRDWGAATGTLSIETSLEGGRDRAAARLFVRDDQGHPVASPIGPTHFDSQNGMTYFYSPGRIDLTLPAGTYHVTAVHGLTTPVVTKTFKVGEGGTVHAGLRLTEVWKAKENGFASGDHHFHLNYDGPYDLVPDDLLPILAAENVDVGTPLIANLHERLQDRVSAQYEKSTRTRILKFGQEVRPHFHGHTGLIGADTLYWPWFWGSGYPDYGAPVRSNKAVQIFTKKQDGFATYVHPTLSDAPFAEENPGEIPIELIADGVLGDMDGLEIVCVWSDEVGTAEIWYRLLNIGMPVVPMAGTDAFADFYRSPAIGSALAFVDQGGRGLNWERYLANLRAARNFVTNGPILMFETNEKRPGGTVSPGNATFALDLYSAVPVDRVEILVNGQVVWSENGLEKAGNRAFSGNIQLPTGGWIAARALGGETQWPSMDSYPFAHTAPLWIGTPGSTDPKAQTAAATDLLAALADAERRAHETYEGRDITALEERFAAARKKLESLQ